MNDIHFNANVSIRQLRAMHAVAAELSFTRAARRLHLTQSALSVLIRSLEAELGLRLFDRTTRSLALTPSGKEFLPFAERVLNELARGIDQAQDLASHRSGRIVVATSPLLASTLLPPLIAQFQQRHASIRVGLLDVAVGEVCNEITQGHADLGIGTFQNLADGFTQIDLHRDRLVLVCPRNHPLARKRQIRWTQLAGQSLIAMRVGSGIRTLVEQVLHDQRVLLEPAFEVTQVATAVALIRADLGIAILPEYAAIRAGLDGQSDGPALTTVAVARPTVYRTIHALHLSDRSLSPAAQLFFESLRVDVRQLVKSGVGGASLLKD